MAKHSAAPSSRSTGSTPARRPPPASPRRRPRSVATGDVVDTRSPSSVEATVAARATTRADTVRALALADMLQQHAHGRSGPGAESLRELKAMIDGAAPDEVKALRRLLFERAQPVEGVDPDAELNPGWREGGYPYRNLMSRRNYERQKYRLQVELLKLQAWV